MNETKFTKGPWVSSDGDWSEKELVISSESRRNSVSICELDVFFDGNIGVEQKANANLIACAPDMYKAIEELIGMYETEVFERYGEPGLSDDDVAEYKQILKRARGE